MTAPALPGTRDTRTLDERLQAERSGLRRRSLAAVAFGIVAVAATAVAVGTVILGSGRWMELPRVVPFLFWVVTIGAAWFIADWVTKRDNGALAGSALAGTIEHEQGLRAGSLRGALEVGRTGALGQRAAADVARRLSPSALAPQLAAQLAKVLAMTAGVAVVAIALASFAATKSTDGFSAVVHPVRAFRGTLLPALGFDRIPASVPRGMPLTVRIRAEGRSAITVSRRAAGEAWRDTTVSVDAATGMAAVALGPIRAPVVVRVSDGRAPDAEATVTVADRGWIGDVSLLAQFPSYLQRASETLEPVPPLRVPRGTRVRVTATLRGGARNAILTDGRDTVRFDADASARVPEGAPVSAMITLDRDSKWVWAAAATPRDGGETLPPELPDALAFTVVQDKSPQVIIEAPSTDTTIGTTGVVPIIVAASDDHGVRSVSLQLWREIATGGSTKRERIDVAEPASPMFEGGVTIALDGRDLQPGDKVHVVAVATDDSPWSQSTISTGVVLRVPNLSEQRSMVRDLADSLANQAKQLAEQERRLQQNTSDASRNRELKSGNRNDAGQSNGGAKSEAQKNAMSFSAAEKSKQLVKDQKQLGARIDSLRRSAKDLENRLKSAGALDTALASRMRDVQRMLREAMTPEMQKQLQNLEQSSDKLSGTEAQQSLEQLAAQQKQMRDQLEKSAEMLKRAALEGAMGTLRDEAKDLAKAQQQLADRREGKPSQGAKGEQADSDPKSLADRSRDLEKEVEQLAKRLEQEGAKPGASKTRAAQPMVNQAAEAAQRAAQPQQGGEKGQQGQQGQQGDKSQQEAQELREKNADAMQKALDALKDEKDKTAAAAGAKEGEKAGAGAKQQQGGAQAGQQQNSQTTPGAGQKAGQQGEKSGQQGGEQGAQQPGKQPGGQSGQAGQSGNAERQAANAMDKAAQQLASAREAQVDAWKQDLSQQLDQSINETMQLARQQAELEQKAKQQGAQGMQGEQGAVQQGVQQAAERLEKAGRSSSLLSQRSQKAMSEAQRRVQQATQSMGNASQPGGSEAAQSAMKDATDALNQALSSLVRDRERVNNAQSASGFQEMMEQLKQLAQQQGSLNGQMQGLQALPGGAQGQQAKQQGRALARQQRDVAKTLQDVSDADATGRTDALAKEAQSLAQQMERSGVDPNVAARQQQLYRRLLDAGRFLEQDERDDQGPREAKSGGASGRNNIDGPQSGRAGNKYAPPTWNELRGLGPEERRLVIEYFRRLNGAGQ